MLLILHRSLILQLSYDGSRVKYVNCVLVVMAIIPINVTDKVTLRHLNILIKDISFVLVVLALLPINIRNTLRQLKDKGYTCNLCIGCHSNLSMLN